MGKDSDALINSVVDASFFRDAVRFHLWSDVFFNDVPCQNIAIYI